MFDRVVSIVSLILGVSAIYLSQQMPVPVFAGQMGPGVFPLGIGILLVLISVSLFFEQQKKRNTETGSTEKEGTWKEESIVWISLGYILGFVLILKIAGFVISSFLLILLHGWQLGARKWIPLTLTAFLFPGAIYMIFTKLGILLP